MQSDLICLWAKIQLNLISGAWACPLYIRIPDNGDAWLTLCFDEVNGLFQHR